MQKTIEIRHEKGKRLRAISGLKVIAMLMIFWEHSAWHPPRVNVSVRACELFFVAAGFLFIYAHKDRPIACTLKSICRYAGRKFVTIWPLHFLCFIPAIFFVGRDFLFSLKGLAAAALNLTLLHGFSGNSDIYFSFNGVSWFCSTIMVCYLLAPVLSKLLGSLKKALVVFAAAFVLRLFFEWHITAYPDVFWNFSIHVSPFSRIFEFVMGMAAAKVFVSLDGKIPRTKAASALFTFAEAAVICLLAALDIFKGATWLKAIFLVPVSVTVLVFAFDAGLLSKLLGCRPFRFLGSIQLEFFLMHQVIGKGIAYIIPFFRTAVGCRFAAALVLTVALAFVYNRYVQKPLSGKLTALADGVNSRIFK